nr:MAG TPA: hypothetical protein [Caudoviricetes sp.]
MAGHGEGMAGQGMAGPLERGTGKGGTGRADRERRHVGHRVHPWDR